MIKSQETCFHWYYSSEVRLWKIKKKNNVLKQKNHFIPKFMFKWENPFQLKNILIEIILKITKNGK